jgi:nucleoside-diphosphate-sugar epimerase
MARKRTVLLTGACGYVAAQLLPDLRRRYALRLVDARPTDGRGRRVLGVVVADLAHPDRGRYERLFHGVDIVVHLGYAPRDDSEVAYATDVRRLLTGPRARARGGRLGA